jgi:hypothetical protein
MRLFGGGTETNPHLEGHRRAAWARAVRREGAARKGSGSAHREVCLEERFEIWRRKVEVALLNNGVYRACTRIDTSKCKPLLIPAGSSSYPDLGLHLHTLVSAGLQSR